MFNSNFENNKLVEALLDIIDQSHNYIRASFTTDYVELVYWVKDPYKYTKTQIFFYDDYGMKPLKHRKTLPLRDYVYDHMALNQHHRKVDDALWHNEKQAKPIACIYPITYQTRR